jgi:hypothetical protein
MITINGVNKWTPAIYKSESPVDWTAERNKSANFRSANKTIASKRNNSVLFKAK